MEIKLLKNAITEEKRFYVYCKKEERVCHACEKEIEEGFVCENKQTNKDGSLRIYCNKCQEEFIMHRCKHDKQGEHRHIKVYCKDVDNQEMQDM